MDTLIQASLSGVAIGCVYSLVALGFVLIYKATGVLNFAQGELMMVGAYIYFSLVTSLDMTPLLAFGATLVLAGLLGALVERLVLHPLVDEPPFTLVMVTIYPAACCHRHDLVTRHLRFPFACSRRCRSPGAGGCAAG